MDDRERERINRGITRPHLRALDWQYVADLTEAVEKWLLRDQPIDQWDAWREGWINLLSARLGFCQSFQPTAFVAASHTDPFACTKIAIVPPKIDEQANAAVIVILQRLLDRVVNAGPPPAAAPAAATVLPFVRPSDPKDIDESIPTDETKTPKEPPPSYPPPKYYASAHWHAVADGVRRAWEFKCVLNVRHRGRVEGHHRDYSHLGAEGPLDVVPLCEECHQRLHDRLPRQPLLVDDLERAA